MKKLAIVAALIALPTAAFAQTEPEVPLFSLSRLSFAVGANAVWQVLEGPSVPEDSAPRYEVGLYGAYNLSKYFSISGSVQRKLDAEEFEVRLGGRVRLGQ